MIALRQHLADLRQERGRITTTILGVVWGTMAVTILLAFSESLLHSVREAEQGIGKGVVVVQNGSTSLPFEGLPAGRPIQMTAADVEAVRASVGQDADISGEYLRSNVEVTYSSSLHRTLVAAVQPPYGYIRNCRPAAGGRFIDEWDIRHGRRVAFIGDELKREIFGADDAVGKTVSVDGVSFTIVGVMQSKLQWAYYEAPDAKRLFIPFTTYEATWEKQPVSAIVYRAFGLPASNSLDDQVRNVLASRHRFDPKDRLALSIWDTAEGVAITDGVHRGVRAFAGLIGAVTLIIAGLGVGNVMYTLVKSRTREIGIKIAVGARPGDITRYYLVEGFVIVAAGGGLGLLTSWLIILTLNCIPLPNEALLYFGRPTLSPFTIVAVTAFLGMVGLLAGLFPARQAALTDPVCALRYE